MESLELLGNASVVPIVIFLTQLIKKRLGGGFKYKSDAVALVLSLVLCLGWTFYYMTPADFSSWCALAAFTKFKWFVDELVVGFATWLAASKIYDLGHGNKKREKEVTAKIDHVTKEKSQLEEEIVKLKNGNGGVNGQIQEDPQIASELREILER